MDGEGNAATATAGHRGTTGARARGSDQRSADANDSWRDRIRANPRTKLVWRIAVFLGGLALIALGIALAVLPGPLTIPPVLLGLWVWSTEFEWAHRMLKPIKRKAKDAWAHGKRHPVSTSVITAVGLLGAVAAFWAVYHFHLVDRGKEVLGL
ncbi:MAG: PGPGW domain-containing protein [Nocardioidaceae bacterium]